MDGRPRYAYMWEKSIVAANQPCMPFHGSVRTASSMVGVPFTGTLGRGRMGVYWECWLMMVL